MTTVDIDPSIDPRDPRLPGSTDTIVVFSGLICSFTHLAVHRLHETRVNGSPHLFLYDGTNLANPGCRRAGSTASSEWASQ